MTIERKEVGPRMSQIVVHGDTVYLAGIVAQASKGKSVTDQTKEILSTIDNYLAQAGTDKSKLLRANGSRPATRRRAPASRPNSPRPTTRSRSWWWRRSDDQWVRRSRVSNGVKNKVLRSIETDSGNRCVDIFLRPDGSFGFEEYRRDSEDGRGWFPVGFHSEQVCATEAAAFDAALEAVSWLREVVAAK
jgi:hypothetical protein